MCGICGVYSFSTGRPAESSTIQRMMRSIHHRGPDDEGMLLDGPLGLGFQRLSIIDLSSGHQPMFNEDGSIGVVFNGEIYNYPELRELLLSSGHRLATRSDTEVLVHLYEEFGEDCVNHLRGMFGFAIWDRPRQKLFVARDRLGIKPLYFCRTDDGIIFGSEIKAILEHGAIEPRLNYEALGNFLSLKYVPSPQTMFAGIESLPPGCLLTCDMEGTRVRRYWDVSYARAGQARRSEAEYAEELEGLLKECVRMHLMSDVPFGAFLSGGIDSSTVVALMSQYLDQPVKTFSVGYSGSGEGFSELPYARMVAEHYQTEHREVLIGARDFADRAESVVWHLDQPIADEAAVANFMVSKLAAQHVKMVLTGEGGDELFAGYARYSGERLSPLFRPIPQSIKRPAVTLAQRLPGLRGAKLALSALVHESEAERYMSWFTMFNRERKEQLLTQSAAEMMTDSSPAEVFSEHLTRTDARAALNRMLYVDTKLWLPDDLLARGDKTSMAVSLEARVPLLDHKLVEFAASLPTHLKIKRLTRKYLLRSVATQLLPEPVINRKKLGFSIPTSVWFRSDIRDWVRDTLAPDTIQRRGLFSTDYVQRLLHEHDSGFANHGNLIWGLITVELWHRQFLDRSQSHEALESRRIPHAVIA